MDYIKTLDKMCFGQRWIASHKKNSQEDYAASSEEKIFITLLKYGIDGDSIKIDSPKNVFKHYILDHFCNHENVNVFIYFHDALLVWKGKGFLQTLGETFLF